MLKKAGESTGLEFNSPAHGNWNIVHTGMLLPESIQIYVCADNCMRGVVLTAAEMNAADRFSFVIVEEEDLLNGNLEDVTIEGVTDVLRKRKDHPKAVLLFTVCLHHFLGCDLERVYEELEARFPDIFFVRCYMDPIMQKHGLTPDQKLRKAIYDGLKMREENPKAVTILGSDFALDETSDIRRLLKWKHIEVKELPECNSWKSYQELADSKIFIACYPPGKYGLECQAERLRKKALYLPGSFDYDEIIRQWKTLEQAVGENVEEVEGIEDTDMHMEKSLKRITKREIALCESALEQARKVVGDVPIMIDHTFHPRPLELAKLLLTHGFSVTRIYLDAVNPEEKDTFEWLKEQYPELEYEPTIRPEMRMKPRNESDVLAIGQKASWFTGTRHFVNLVEGAGLYGFDGIRRTAELMTEAWQEEKDPEDLIIRKGWGTYKMIPIYTADVSGVCSALYELGGMTVMHDPSGCNSTYNTHDEIRWYEQDSMIYISGLTEIDAVMGNDEKMICDIELAAEELKPKFIALAGSPIPYMNGTDFPAIARMLEQDLGIPAFSIPTNGMHDYVYGAGLALAEIAKRIKGKKEVTSKSVNLLGVTPLDFGPQEHVDALKRNVEETGWKVLSTWAMGDTLEDLGRAPEAEVNLVVSSVGLWAAKVLQERFGTPYVIGTPIRGFMKSLLNAIEEKKQVAYLEKGRRISLTGNKSEKSSENQIILIGEPVIMESLAVAIETEYQISVRVICPIREKKGLLADGDIAVRGEEELEQVLQRSKNVKGIVADPLYRPVCPENVAFYELPHIAFSGRIYKKKLPVLAELI